VPRSTRSNNFDLIRWMQGGHKPTCKKLEHLTNENYVSKMACGDMDISDSMARNIEKCFNMPDGWLDRNNEGVINISQIEFELLCVLREKSVTAKQGLLDLLLN
jgi:hypothetical protein